MQLFFLISQLLYPTTGQRCPLSTSTVPGLARPLYKRPSRDDHLFLNIFLYNSIYSLILITFRSRINVLIENFQIILILS